ncbi:MAG: SCP2 sterol-binding domain-containing protein [Candidatus Thorarchaeota archaeon]
MQSSPAVGAIKMPGFESTDQLKDVFEEFWNRATKEVEVMEKLAKAEVIVRFDIEQPEAQITIDFKNPGPDGKVGQLMFGDAAEPEIKVWSKSETTNKFWHGKLNTAIALARGQVKIQGPVSKAIGLVSKIKPLYAIWPEVLKDKGLDHMLLT